MEDAIKEQGRFMETKQVLKEDQMSGAAYGQEFGQALDKTQQDACGHVHFRSLFNLLKGVWLWIRPISDDIHGWQVEIGPVLTRFPAFLIVGI
jgi:hypothetical protein